MLAAKPLRADVPFHRFAIPKEISGGNLSENPSRALSKGAGMTAPRFLPSFVSKEELRRDVLLPWPITTVDQCHGGRRRAGLRWSDEGAMCAAADGFSRVTAKPRLAPHEGPGSPT